MKSLNTKTTIIKKKPMETSGFLLCIIGILFVGALIILTMSGCSSIDKAYVIADRATYEAIAPEYTQYVNRDDSLRDWEKSLRVANVESWDDRIVEAEKE